MLWSSDAVRLCRAQRRLHHRQLDHAAKAQPRRRRAGPRQDRPAQRRAGCAADGDEGAAARLSKGHAGGQGAGVRGGRRARIVPGGDRRHGARHAPRPRAAARSRGARLQHRDRPRRLAGARRWACRSAAPTTSPARSSSAPRPRAAPSPNCRSPRCRRSSRRSPPRSTRCSTVERSVASRTSFGGTAPARVRAADPQRAGKVSLRMNRLRRLSAGDPRRRRRAGRWPAAARRARRSRRPTSPNTYPRTYPSD